MHVPLGFPGASLRPGERVTLHAKVGVPGYFLGERLIVTATRGLDPWERLRTWFMVKLSGSRLLAHVWIYLFGSLTIVKPSRSRPTLLVRSLRLSTHDTGNEECLAAPMPAELFAEYARGTGDVRMRPCGRGDTVTIEFENVDRAPWWKPWRRRALAHVMSTLIGRMQGTTF